MEMTKLKLKDMCDIVPGYAFKSSDFGEGNNYAVKITDIQPPTIDIPNLDKVLSTPKDSRTLLHKGDFVMAMTGATIGKVGKFDGGKKNVYINQRVCKFIPKEGTDKSFLFYLVSQLNFRKFIFSNVDSSSAQPNIGHPTMYRYEQNVPNYENQKKIAAVLSALDDKIALNKKMNQKLEAMAKRLYDYWFVQFDFPDENGRPYKTSGGPMVYDETLKREIPEDWVVDNLYAVADYINGMACQNNRPKEGESSLPVIKIREMSDGITSDTEEVSENIPLKYIIENGDILFSWSATLMVMIWAGGKGGLNQHIFKVVPKNGFPKEFVYQLLADYIVNFQQIALSRKTTMGHITSDHINLSRIVLPSKEVLEAYSKKVCPIFMKIVENQIEFRKLTALRDKLLPLLMNGQVTIA